LGFSAVPEDGFLDAAGASVVEQEVVPIDCAEEAEAPQWSGPPFPFQGLAIRPSIGKALAHVMQEKVGVGMEALTGDFRKGIGAESDGEGLAMAGGASDQVKEFLTFPDIVIIGIAAGRGCEGAHIMC
jgi:hypothetical protein